VHNGTTAARRQALLRCEVTLAKLFRMLSSANGTREHKRQEYVHPGGRLLSPFRDFSETGRGLEVAEQ
jgi:hypothetical protein